MKKLRTLLLIVGLAAGLASPAAVRAQVVPASMEVLATDSAAWQRVITAVVEMMSPQLVRGAMDPAPQAWQITLPSDEPQSGLLGAQLWTLFRARVPTDADRVTHRLELGPLHVEGETARVHMRSEVVQRCPGSTTSTIGFCRAGMPANVTGSVYGPRRSGCMLHFGRRAHPAADATCDSRRGGATFRLTVASRQSRHLKRSVAAAALPRCGGESRQRPDAAPLTPRRPDPAVTALSPAGQGVLF